jgi:hypothetical protein
MSHRPPIRCLRCHRNINQQTQIAGEKVPEDGDVSICGYCGFAAIFDNDGLTLRFASIEEQDKIVKMPEVKIVLIQLGLIKDG